MNGAIELHIPPHGCGGGCVDGLLKTGSHFCTQDWGNIAVDMAMRA
jgi:hypothetical protein